MSIPSMLAGRSEEALPPAAEYSVGSQSWTFIIWVDTRGDPNSCADQTKPAPRTPPSHRVFFTWGEARGQQNGNYKIIQLPSGFPEQSEIHPTWEGGFIRAR